MRRMKRAYRGLYGNRMIQFGNKVSFAENKTRRTWKPNVHRLSFYSEATDRVYRFRITTHALRDIRKFGGLDEYLLRTHDTEIKYPAALRLKQCVKIIRASKQLPKDTAIPEFHSDTEANALIVERLPSEQSATNRVGLHQVL